ncbi:hypothetical protein KAX06_00990 [candidate division WOR-3 bacterium]|nr:hypothetical protein [candidate division WOR-3 bacterium]
MGLLSQKALAVVDKRRNVEDTLEFASRTAEKPGMYPIAAALADELKQVFFPKLGEKETRG